MANEWKDALGVVIEVGDVVRTIHYGYGIHLYDVNKTATVTGFTPQGNVKHDSDIRNGKPLRNGCVAVQRRDGQPGHEGNVR